MQEKSREILETIVKEVATSPSREPETYTPMLVTDNASVEEMDRIMEGMRAGALRCLDMALQRGKSSFADIEAITVAMAAMCLHPSADKITIAKTTAIGGHLDRLIKLITSRETVEINQETADRIRSIETALGEMTNE